MIAVVCQNAGAVRAFARDHPLPYPLAIDEGRAVARAFGVYTLLGFDSINIARPATFVVDAAGVVRRRFVARFQWQRMPLDEILAALDRLAVGRTP